MCVCGVWGVCECVLSVLLCVVCVLKISVYIKLILELPTLKPPMAAQKVPKQDRQSASGRPNGRRGLGFFLDVPLSVWTSVLVTCGALISVLLFVIYNRMGLAVPFPIQPVANRDPAADRTVLQTVTSLPLPPGTL